MPPEAVSGAASPGEAAVGTKADVYGLGMVAWEMASGERPFEGLTLEEVKLISTNRFLYYFKYNIVTGLRLHRAGQPSGTQERIRPVYPWWILRLCPPLLERGPRREADGGGGAGGHKEDGEDKGFLLVIGNQIQRSKTRKEVFPPLPPVKVCGGHRSHVNEGGRAAAALARHRATAAAAANAPEANAAGDAQGGGASSKRN